MKKEKKKRGQPRKWQEETVSLRFQVPISTKIQLKQIADYQGISMTEMIVQLVKNDIEGCTDELE